MSADFALVATSRKGLAHQMIAAMARKDEVELAACAIAMFLTVAARGGSTLLESKDRLRLMYPHFERDLSNNWDQLRSLP